MSELVTLATQWDPSVDPTGHWMSEKLDGVLALWDGRQFLSRGGNTFNAPDWFLRAMPQERLLGELYIGHGKFSDTLSVVRKARPKPVEWARITYRVFDAPDIRGSYETRLHGACLTILSMQSMWSGDTKRPPYTRKDLPVMPIMQVPCESPDHFDAFHREIVGAGGEGTMLRKHGSLYRTGRTPDLMKRKDWYTEEARVIGHNMNPDGFRSLRCVLVSDGKTEFDVSSGLTAEQVAHPIPMGALVTVKYKQLTEAGHLREPSFIAVRDYE